MAILGESFKKWVRDQINVRQEKLSARNKDTDLLKYLTSRTAFLRLTSGVDIDENLLSYYKDYLPEGFVTTVKGNELAKQYVLEAARFRPPNSTIEDPLQFTSGVGYNNTNKSSYGFLSDSNYGLVPPPGITMANIKSLNRGTIREASIQIVCHNLYQLMIINILFLKLKYSLLLEWGHTVYYDNNGNLMQDYDIPNLSPSFLDGEYDQISLLKTIALQRQLSNGNYDAFFGLVKNFEWQAEENGSYTITISALSTGDVIESLKINTNFNPNIQGPSVAFSKSTLHKIIGAVRTKIGGSGYIHGYNDGNSPNRLNTLAFSANNPAVNNNYNYRDYYDNDEIVLSPSGSSMLTDKEGFKAAFPALQTTQTKYGKTISSDQYYIKLGTLFRLMEAFALYYDNKKVIVTEDNQRLGSPPMFFLDHDFDKHECLTLPDHVSIDPTIALIPLVEPETKTTTNVTEYAVHAFRTEGYQGIKKYTKESTDAGEKLISDPANPTPTTKIQVPLNSKPIPVGQGYATLADVIIAKFGTPTPAQLKSNYAWVEANEVITPWNGLSKVNLTAQQAYQDMLTNATLNSSGTGYIDWDIWKNKAVNLAPVINPPYRDGVTVIAGVTEDEGKSPAVYNSAIRKYSVKQIQTTVESGNSGTLSGISTSFRTKDQFIGKTMHIYVNTQHIVNVLDDTIEEDGSVPLLPFLNKLLSDIGTALGSINNFDLDYDDETNTFSVVDSAVVPLKYARGYTDIAKFNINALNPNGTSGKNKDILGAGGSFITNFSLKSEIFSSIGNAIALGAQQNGNQPGSNSSGISKINEGVIDRLMTEKTNKIITVSPFSQSFSLNEVKNKYEEYVAKLKATDTNLGLTPEDIDFYKSYVVDLYQHDVGFFTNNTGSYLPGSGFIPLNLQLTMDGLSGLIQYQTFEISENVLPPEYYNKLRFITTTIEHKISFDKGWETTIGTLGVPRSKVGASNAPTIDTINNEIIRINTTKVTQTTETSPEDYDGAELTQPTNDTQSPPTNETKPGTTKKYIVIGDSGTPTIQALTKAKHVGEAEGEKNLHKSGTRADFLIKALKSFSTSPDVKIVVVSVGTNDFFTKDVKEAKALMGLLKEKFPNAKYLFVQGTWGFGKYFPKDERFNKPTPEPKEVREFYAPYKDEGAIIIEPPIGYSTKHPGSGTPTYHKIAEEINRYIALNQ